MEKKELNTGGETYDEKTRIHTVGGVVYVLTAALLLVGTFYDLQIDKALYNPENAFALFLQKYGEVPRFALWGPAAAVLYASRELFVRRFWNRVNK